MSSQAVTISYHSVAGEIGSVCYEQGGAVTNMLRDGVGSVVSTTGPNNPNQLGRRYGAYGTCLSGQTDWSDFQMGWVGSHGYRRTDLSSAELYVRARHYSTVPAAWTTKDPIWPSESSRTYVNGSPLTKFDPSGLQSCPFDPPRQPDGPPTPPWSTVPNFPIHVVTFADCYNQYDDCLTAVSKRDDACQDWVANRNLDCLLASFLCEAGYGLCAFACYLAQQMDLQDCKTNKDAGTNDCKRKFQNCQARIGNNLDIGPCADHCAKRWPDGGYQYFQCFIACHYGKWE